jgi:hypothetical protein
MQTITIDRQQSQLESGKQQQHVLCITVDQHKRKREADVAELTQQQHTLRVAVDKHKRKREADVAELTQQLTNTESNYRLVVKRLRTDVSDREKVHALRLNHSNNIITTLLARQDHSETTTVFSLKSRGLLHSRRDYDTIMVPCFSCSKSIDSRICPIGRLDRSRPNFYCGKCNATMIELVPSVPMTKNRCSRWDSYFVNEACGVCVVGS